MFKKLKDILGIEGVKISIEFDYPLSLEEGIIHGDLELSTLREQVVENIELKFVEKYQRGRKDNMLIDEYDLGKMLMTEPIHLKEGESKKIHFQLPFVENKSEMDHIGSQGLITKGFVALAKKIKGVKSTYKFTAKAKVQGTTFSPSATREVIFND